MHIAPHNFTKYFCFSYFVVISLAWGPSNKLHIMRKLEDFHILYLALGDNNFLQQVGTCIMHIINGEAW